MAEETPQPASSEEPPKKSRPAWFDGKKGGNFKPSAKMRAAITEVLGRERMGFRPDYKQSAANHDVKPESLRRMMHEWRHGRIDISSPPDEIDKRETQMRAENEKSLLLLSRYERVLNTVFEFKLKNAEKQARANQFEDIDRDSIAKIVMQLQAAREARIKLEKGVLAILERLMEMQNRRDQNSGQQSGHQLTQNNVTVNFNGHAEKPATGSPVMNAEMTADADEQAILRALAPPERESA